MCHVSESSDRRDMCIFFFTSTLNQDLFPDFSSFALRFLFKPILLYYILSCFCVEREQYWVIYYRSFATLNLHLSCSRICWLNWAIGFLSLCGLLFFLVYELTSVVPNWVIDLSLIRHRFRGLLMYLWHQHLSFHCSVLISSILGKEIDRNQFVAEIFLPLIK